MLNKNFVLFVLILVFFLAGSIFLFTLYWSWGDTPVDQENSLEVSLPVINWDKYINLSKHLD